MILIFIIIAILVLFKLGPLNHLIKMDKEHQEKLQEKVAIQVGTDRPKPKGKHCPVHDWHWIEGTGHYCSWCKKTPRQIQEGF